MFCKVCWMWKVIYKRLLFLLNNRVWGLCNLKKAAFQHFFPLEHMVVKTIGDECLRSASHGVDMQILSVFPIALMVESSIESIGRAQWHCSIQCLKLLSDILLNKTISHIVIAKLDCFEEPLFTEFALLYCMKCAFD